METHAVVQLYVVGKCRIETPHTILLPRAQLLFGLATHLIQDQASSGAAHRDGERSDSDSKGTQGIEL